MIEQLVGWGPDLEAVNFEGLTALGLSALRRPDVLNELLDVGYSPNTVNTGGDSLLYQLAVGHLESIAHARARTEDPEDARAARSPYGPGVVEPTDYLDAMEFVLDSGGNPNAQNGQQSTPLHVLAKGGHVECIDLLLSRGACPDLADDTGATPLHVAASCGHAQGFVALVRGGADLMKRDGSGSTALDKAVSNADTQTVGAVIEYLVDQTSASGG